MGHETSESFPVNFELLLKHQNKILQNPLLWTSCCKNRAHFLHGINFSATMRQPRFSSVARLVVSPYAFRAVLKIDKKKSQGHKNSIRPRYIERLHKNADGKRAGLDIALVFRESKRRGFHSLENFICSCVNLGFANLRRGFQNQLPIGIGNILFIEVCDAFGIDFAILQKFVFLEKSLRQILSKFLFFGMFLIGLNQPTHSLK